MFEELRARSVVYLATYPDKPLSGGRKTIIARAVLGSDAGLLGAARLPVM